MEEFDTQNIDQETPAEDVFIAPSFHEVKISAGVSYTYHSLIPTLIENNLSTECVLGVDEAGRGPVLGTELLIRQPETSLTVQARWCTACSISL